ncbi:SRPBCC family protein [Streptomyces rochei]|uniref:SRPBCC family protein n=1 Tax=Streptomyces TaxID=1883 RepID=UPI00109E38A1|nr:SRPBCC family protein [Streptomyces sp. SS52]QCB24415.1 SRPBCC family protein [Streptomyces sp. SS52]
MNSTGTPSRHIGVRIDRTADDVYAFASDPANMPAWAHGLGRSIRKIDGRWVAEDSPLGRVVVTFTPPNDLGVLDHDVTLPSGETVHNPLRVIGDGTGCEVVFALRRRPGQSDADFERDAAMVTADLSRLRELLESA